MLMVEIVYIWIVSKVRISKPTYAGPRAGSWERIIQIRWLEGQHLYPTMDCIKLEKTRYNKGCYCKIFNQRKLQCFNHQRIVATTSTSAVPFCIILQVPSYLQPLSPQDLGQFWGTGCVFGLIGKRWWLEKEVNDFEYTIGYRENCSKTQPMSNPSSNPSVIHSNLLQHSLKHPIHRVYINNMYVNGYSSG